MTYAEFCRYAETPLTAEEWASTDETPASEEELHWRMGYQVRRAILHKRAGRATVPDLGLVAEKTNIVVTMANYRRAHAAEY